MRLTFWGAARTVTGSKHLLTGRPGAVLLDCGLFQGHRAEAEARNRALPFAPGALDAVVLSHAHIDHSGALPHLCRHGYEGPIHATPATIDLCRAMLLDAAHIQEKDAEFLNRHKRGRARRPVQPLYGPRDVEEAMTRFTPHGYGVPFPVLDGVRATFHDAGHILGSASVHVEWKENGRSGSVVFSGDLGRPGRPILRDPEPLPGADHLLIEGTYGGKRHPDEVELHTAFAQVMREALDRGGRVVIPAFAVGRTQEVVYALDRLREAGRLPEVPVFIDSPLAADIQEIVQKHREVFDRETSAALGRGEDPLGTRRVTMVRNAEDSMRLNDRPGTFVTISASGMCEGGRILHHLKHTVEDPKHTIVIVGYQAEGTLGRRLVEGAEEVRIFGELHPRRARVVVLNGFSAHADHDALVRQAVSCGPRKGCAIVHADLLRAEALRDALPMKAATRIPSEGESWELQ